MKLIVTNEAEEVLIQRIGYKKSFIITSLNPRDYRVADMGPCAKGSHFQIIPRLAENRFNEQYKWIIENEQFRVYVAQSDVELLGEWITIEFNHLLNSFTLKNEHHILDHNIKLKDYFFS